MHVAAFLPSNRIQLIRQFFRRTELFSAASWEDLNQRLGNRGADLALIDPSAEGVMNLDAATTILRRHRATPVVAYVTATNDNLSAVARLSRYGLADVLLSPYGDDGVKLFEMVQRFAGHRLAHAFLGVVEAQLGRLQPALYRAAQDVFERPHRYQTAVDIAHESNLSTKVVYRAFNRAQLGTPSRFVTASKVLRGVAYLRETGQPVWSVGRKVGYSRPRVFSKQFKEVFGCSPSSFRRSSNEIDVLERVLEWLYKPPAQVLARGRAMP